MYASSTDLPDDDAQVELFPSAWLTTEPLCTLVRTAPTGVARLQAIRSPTGQIIDFHYQLVNPIQCALTNQPAEDLFARPLTRLHPDVLQTGMLNRLIGVITTGQPGQHVEEYHLDGVLGRYNQLYFKSDDGVLMLIQDVTYFPLSAGERDQQMALFEAIQAKTPVTDIRAKLVRLMNGQTT